MKLETVQYKMNMPMDIMAKLKEAAISENRSVSGQIIRLLRQQIGDTATTQK